MPKVINRRWTIDETSLFVDILADPENEFIRSLEMLALKKSSNNELFQNLKDIIDEELEKEDFIKKNEVYFKDRLGRLFSSQK